VAHINPVAKICDIAKKNNIVTVVDGVSYAGHGFSDIAALGCDVYLFSLYKTFGEARKRLVPAGPDHAQVAAAAGVAEYFDALHEHHFPGSAVSVSKRQNDVHELMRNHERALLQPLLDYFASLNNVRLLGPSDANLRAPTVTVDVGSNADAYVRGLAEHKVMCSSGHFYAKRLIEALGVDSATGALRMSFVHYTEESEVQQLISGFDAVNGQLS